MQIPSPRGELERRLTPFVEQLMALTRIPGMAVGVVAGGETIYARGFGVTSLDVTRPATPEILFHMASVTKPFVATAIMQLVEAGSVDLDAPVIQYLPYFRLADERFERITVRQMLSHTSGMPDTDDYGWDRPEYDDGALERYVRSLSGDSLIAEPGARYEYSNVAYEVLGDLIAKVSGMTFEAMVAERILQPLGMVHSTLLRQEAEPGLLSQGHALDETGEARVSPIVPYNRAHAPSSTMYSNAHDMCRWAAALLNGGALDGSRILEAVTLETMWQPVARKHPYWHEHVGLCWTIDAYRGLRRISHGGSDEGYRSELFLVPEAGVAAVAMSNADYVFEAPWTAATAALEILLGPGFSSGA